MTWIWRYRLRLFLRNSFWVFPSLGVLAALGAGQLVRELERLFDAQSNLPPEAARTVLITLASSMFTFVVFVSSIMLLALQLASAQLTPRIIAMFFRDPATKAALTLFVFTFTFVVVSVLRIDTAVPLLTQYLAAYSSVVSLAVFFYLIDHVGKSLRPNEVLRTVALQGRQVIAEVYPRHLADAGDPPEPGWPGGATPSATIAATADGVVLACDVQALVTLAERTDCVLELVPQVGDFVAAGDPLFRVYAPGPPPPGATLRRLVAIGHERTMEQDPAFAFRIIVDIACKALSPAINDPTTAVLAIDQLHHLLRNVGRRHLDDERIRDAQHRLRFIQRSPGWGDFVRLAVTEVRHFGCESIQVARRLRAMLADLIRTLPPERRALLHEELSLLQRSAARFFPEPEDQALAAVCDSQGVGGRTDGEATVDAAPASPPPPAGGST